MPQREATGSVLALAPARPTGRVQNVQGLLNLARKAEVKLAKLEKSKTKAQAQWQAFQEGLKESYLREQARFQKHTAQLDADIAEASLEQESVRQAFIGDLSGAMQIDAEGQSAEEQWTQMKSSWEQEDDAYLRDIINGRPGAPVQARAPVERTLSPDIQRLLAHFSAQCFPGGGGLPAAMVAPSTGIPPGLSGAPPVPPGTIPAPMSTSMPPPQMTVDPGQTDHAGPVGHVPIPTPAEGLGAEPSAEAPAELPADGPAGPAGSKARRALGQSGLPVRRAVKTHTKPTSPLAGRPTLAEKLEHKREAALAGLQSGGIGGLANTTNAAVGPTTPVGPMQSGEPPGPVRYEIQEDDDSDSDLEVRANEE